MVKEIKDKTVVVDLNHPLAGKTLVFEIKVLGIEPPSKGGDSKATESKTPRAQGRRLEAHQLARCDDDPRRSAALRHRGPRAVVIRRPAPRGAVGTARLQAPRRLGRSVGHPVACPDRARLVLDRAAPDDVCGRRPLRAPELGSHRLGEPPRRPRPDQRRRRHDPAPRLDGHAGLSPRCLGHRADGARRPHRRSVASPLRARRDDLESPAPARHLRRGGEHGGLPAHRDRSLRGRAGRQAARHDPLRGHALRHAPSRRGSVEPRGLPSRRGLLLHAGHPLRADPSIRPRHDGAGRAHALGTGARAPRDHPDGDRRRAGSRSSASPGSSPCP